jgi:hypothetical protein
MILLLACASPEPAPKPPEDTATSGEEPAPTLAGCVVTGDVTFFDTLGSSHWTQLLDDDARLVSTTEITVYDSGAAYNLASTWDFGDDGCLSAWTVQQAHASTEGEAVRARDTNEFGVATCDAHGAQDHRETTQTLQETLDGEVVEATEDTWVDTIANVWEDDRLVESVITTDDGSSARTTSEFDDDGLPVASAFYDPADAETPTWVWSATYEDGLVAHAETVLATGQSASFDYLRDESGRVTLRTRTQTDEDDVDIDVVAYLYDDAWPWYTYAQEDEDADGDVDETEVVTYDCP